MTIVEAAEAYTQARRQNGISFDKGRSRLIAFSRCVNNKPLCSVSASDIVRFLGDPRTATASWRAKHQLLGKFLNYWAVRGEIEIFEMPPLPIPVRQTYIPHIYTKEEVRRLSRAARMSANTHPASLSPNTLRLLVLFLYGTGAFVGQVLNLRWDETDLDKGVITLRRQKYGINRVIPIAKDLIELLEKHRKRAGGKSEFVFTNKRGQPMQVSLATECFSRLRTKASVLRLEPHAPPPRLHDMRATFAVHRIEQWLQKGMDLNQMMPALSAYMGLSNLMNSERYMDLAPGKFRNELKALSACSQGQHWRDDPELMRFLASL